MMEELSLRTMSEEEDQQLLFDREQLTDLVFVTSLQEKRIQHLETQLTRMCFLFVLYVIVFTLTLINHNLV